MTDIPGWAVELCCLLLGMLALRRDGRKRAPLLCTSMLVGLFGFSIREFALAAPAAVLVAIAISDRQHWRRYVLTGLAMAFVCGLVFLWTSNLPGHWSLTLSFPTVERIGNLAQAIITLYLFLFPIFLMAWRYHFPGGKLRLNRFQLVGGLSGAAIATAPVVGALLHKGVHKGLNFFIGGFFTKWGYNGNTVLLGSRPVLFPEGIWLVLEMGAILGTIVGGILLGGAVGKAFLRSSGQGVLTPLMPKWVGSPKKMLAIFCVLYGGGLAVYVLLIGPMYDRYLWPFAVPMAALLIGKQQSAATGDEIDCLCPHAWVVSHIFEKPSMIGYCIGSTSSKCLRVFCRSLEGGDASRSGWYSWQFR